MVHPKIAELSHRLQAAVAIADQQSIESICSEIAEFVNTQKEQQEQQKQLEFRTRNIQLCCEVAKKFPCVACGGELKYCDSHCSGYDYGRKFVCVSCGRDCGRSSDIKDETETQELLKRNIESFKTLIKKVAKVGGIKVRFGKNLTSINGKPFTVFNRQGHYTVLAYKHGGHYNHQSLQSGHPDWTVSLDDVADVCETLFGLEYDEGQVLKRKIRQLPVEERYLKNV